MSNIRPTSLSSASVANMTLRGRSIRGAGQFFCALLLVLSWATSGFAIPFSEYRDQVRKAIKSLDLLTQTNEAETESQRAESLAVKISSARATLPRTETVEWRGAGLVTDNSWFADELQQFEETTGSVAARANLLDRVRERLLALQDRLEETSKGESAQAFNDDEMRGRLAAILRRSEYAAEVTKPSALDRLLRWVFELLNKLLPRNRQLSPGRASFISAVAQVLVAALALAVIVYVIWLAAPRLLGKRQIKKKTKAEARVVLGERLEPDQSGADLLAEAEALARAGDQRAAIRKGYIALLVELGDRNLISLAQYKTNRDYLRSVREIEALHGNMVKLTSSFEQHWYGLALASETDWTTFRDFYRAALASS